MIPEEIYHLIEQVINNRHPQNWRIVKEVEQCYKKLHLDRQDLIQDTYLEYLNYPHSPAPRETPIQSISRFTYNYLRRKQNYYKERPVYIEDLPLTEHPYYDPRETLTQAQAEREHLLEIVREELSDTDIGVLIKEIGVRKGAAERGMRQEQYKDYLVTQLNTVRSRWQEEPLPNDLQELLDKG